MTRSTVAVIGTGAAGLVCGYLLHERFDLTVYEQNDYLGGHANSVTIEHNGETVRFDTAFVVFNDPAYPLFLRLLEELKVPHMRCPMSFSFQIMPSGLQYMTRGLTYCFCDLENLLNPRFLKMLFEMGRFHRQASAVLTHSRYWAYSIDEYVKEKGYSDDFKHSFLIPLIAVTWSLPPEKMLDYPVLTLVEFLHHHGALQGLFGGKQWRTVINGSRSYVEAIARPFQERIYTNRGVARVERKNGSVEVTDHQGHAQVFDHVIFACHADQALGILADPSPLEQRLLSRFKYNRVTVVVHTDASVMPRKRRHWAGWNYYGHDDRGSLARSSYTYHMNTLQKVSKKTDYFVTIGGRERVDDAKILKEFTYEHPLFDLDSIHAQAELHKLNESGHSFFCGSYFRYGFHEDAFRSGVEVCRKLSGDPIYS